MKEKDLIFGIRPVMEAIQSGKEIDRVLVQKGLKGDLFSELNTALHKEGIPMQSVPKEKLNRITRKNHQGVICYISPIRFQSIEQVLPLVYEKGETPLIVILDRITDVRNFGAVCRSAECYGVDAVIIPNRGAARISSDAVKTSAGALLNIHVCRAANMLTTVKFLQDSGVQVVACTEKASDNCDGFDLTVPVAIILGSEENGISNELLKKADGLIRIPMTGKTGSLNVSVAAGIVLYETIRQREGST